MKLWLSRQRSGAYMLTRGAPVRQRITGTSDDDLYVPYGDPVGHRNFCENGIHALGIELELLESARVEMTMTKL